MTARRRWRLAAFLTAGAFLATSPASAGDLASVRAHRAALQRELDEAAERLATTEARVADLAAKRDAVARQLQHLRAEIDAAEQRVSERVRLLYMRGNVDPMLALISTREPADALERATVVVGLVRDDKAASEVASAKRDQAAAFHERFETRQAELDAALAAQRRVSFRLQGDLEEAAALERRLEQEARQRRLEQQARVRAAALARRPTRQAEAALSAPHAPRSSRVRPTGAYACPVGQPRSFTDTWGDPRSGGRRHRGTDILAPYGAPIYAVTDGVVDRRSYGSSAGYWLIFDGADGNDYWYLHLQGYTVPDGARVGAGSQIATNGDTGNARGTPHLHFELHPGGGGAINPYPFLLGIC